MFLAGLRGRWVLDRAQGHHLVAGTTRHVVLGVRHPGRGGLTDTVEAWGHVAAQAQLQGRAARACVRSEEVGEEAARGSAGGAARAASAQQRGDLRLLARLVILAFLTVRGRRDLRRRRGCDRQTAFVSKTGREEDRGQTYRG